jgi:hypothetical protein
MAKGPGHGCFWDCRSSRWASAQQQHARGYPSRMQVVCVCCQACKGWEQSVGCRFTVGVPAHAPSPACVWL